MADGDPSLDDLRSGLDALGLDDARDLCRIAGLSVAGNLAAKLTRLRGILAGPAGRARRNWFRVFWLASAGSFDPTDHPDEFDFDSLDSGVGGVLFGWYEHVLAPLAAAGASFPVFLASSSLPDCAVADENIHTE
jgi:hypothetical protein